MFYFCNLLLRKRDFISVELCTIVFTVQAVFSLRLNLSAFQNLTLEHVLDILNLQTQLSKKGTILLLSSSPPSLPPSLPPSFLNLSYNSFLSLSLLFQPLFSSIF